MSASATSSAVPISNRDIPAPFTKFAVGLCPFDATGSARHHAWVDGFVFPEEVEGGVVDGEVDAFGHGWGREQGMEEFRGAAETDAGGAVDLMLWLGYIATWRWVKRG